MNSSLKKLACAIMMILCASCTMPIKRELVPVSLGSTPQAWIDAPLDGSILPLAPYEIVFHLTDPVSIIAGELAINGASVGALPAQNGSGTLIHYKYLWTPPGTGMYTITARGQGQTGNWSESAVAVVTILRQITISPTTTDFATVTPTSTNVITLTPTPTLTITPIPVTSLTFDHSTSTSQFFFGACDPNFIELTVQVTGSDTVKYMLVFTHLANEDGNERTDWDDGRQMQFQGNGTFTIKLPATSIAGYNRFNPAWFLYQFIATNSKNKIIGRSEVFGGISLAPCGGGGGFTFPTLPIIIRPTKTPFIIK